MSQKSVVVTQSKDVRVLVCRVNAAPVITQLAANIHGDVFLARTDAAGELADLTDADIAKYQALWA